MRKKHRYRDYKSGEVVYVDLGDTVGHEQKRKRPAVILSEPKVGGKPLRLIIIIPLTTKKKEWWTMVEINKGESGLKEVSYAMCHQIRSISVERVEERWGKVSLLTLNKIKTVLATLLEITG